MKETKKYPYDKSFFKRSMKILIVMVLSQVLVAAVGFVDNFMITSYGNSDQIHLIAVGAGAEIWFAMSSIFLGVATLFGVLYSQFYASKNKDNFKQTFKINIHASLTTMLVVSLIMYFLAPQLIDLFFLSDHSVVADQAKDIAIDYVRILAIGNLFISSSYLLLNPLLMIGKAKYLLIISTVSLVTNTGFDYIFIYVLDQGASGAAWSTSLSFMLSFSISIYLFRTNWSKFSGMGNVFKIDKTLFKMILKRSWIVLPISLMAWTLVSITMLLSNMYGSELMKSMAVAYAISGIMFTIFPAINQSIKVIISSELGKSNFVKAKAYAKNLLKSVLIVAAIVSAIGVIVAFVLPQALINDSSYADKAKYIILIYSGGLFLYVLNSYYSGIIEAGGNQIQPAIINYFNQLWLVIPAYIITGPWVLDMGFEVSFIISQGTMLIAALISYGLYRRFDWLNNLNEHKGLKKKKA